MPKWHFFFSVGILFIFIFKQGKRRHKEFSQFFSLIFFPPSGGIYNMESVKSRENAFEKMERTLGFSVGFFSLIVLIK